MDPLILGVLMGLAFSGSLVASFTYSEEAVKRVKSVSARLADCGLTVGMAFAISTITSIIRRKIF